MKASDLIRDVTLRVKTTGADQAIAQTTALGKSTDGLSVANDKLSKTQLSVDKALERVQRQIDATYRQQRLFETGQRTLDRAMQQGALSLSDYERNLSLLGAKYGPVSAANDNAARSFGNLASAGKNALSGLSPIAGTAGGIVSALGPVGVAIGLVAAGSQLIANAGDTWTKYGNQLMAAGVASSALAATQRDIAELAISTRSSLEATVGLYARMTRASSELGTSQSDVRRVTEILGKELANSGLSAAEAAGGLLQFSQGLQAGRFQGDELRSVLENLPGVARAIAKEFNTTVGGLRELGSAGELTSERVFKAVLAAGKGIDDAFGKSIPTATQAMEQLATASTRLFAEIDKRLGISANRAKAISELATVANAIATKLDTPTDSGRAAQTTMEYERALKAVQDQIRAFDQRGMALDAANARGEFERLSAEFRNVQNAADAAAMGARNAAAGFGDAAQQANVASSAVAGFTSALRSIQMGIPDVAKVLNAQKSLAELSATSAQAAEKSSVALRAESLDRNDAALAAQRHSQRMQELNAAVTERQRVIVGATDIEKSFNDTLKKTNIDGLEGAAKGAAQAREAYDARNKTIEDSIKLGMNEADVNKARATSEKILAQEMKNVTVANKAKGGSSSAASSGADAYDNALQRSRDSIEELKLQQEQASKTTEEVYRLTEAHKLRRAALSAGRGDEAGMTEAINAQADAYARQRVATEAAIDAQKRFQESARETADTIAGFVKDLVGGEGLDAALKSLGQTYLNNSIDALISGKGPFASALGLAPTTKGGTGGILNLDWNKLTKAVTEGTTQGTFSGFSNLFGSPQQGPTQSGATVDTTSGGLNISGIAGIGGAALGAYGAGASSGALAGGLTGAISGAAAGAAFGPAGMAIGAILGAGAGLLGASSAKAKAKEARKAEAEANYKEAAPQIISLGSQLRGDPQDTLALRIAEAESAARKLGDVAFFAGRVEEQHKLFADFLTYRSRTLKEFGDAYAGMLDALDDGLGPDSPFGRTRDTVKALGDSLKVFIDDTKTVFGDGSAQVGQSRAAAQSYALQVLDGAKTLSVVATRMEEIRGAGVGLQQVLTDLGMSADAAASAIASGTTAALARLKTSFETDLGRRTNDSKDAGYLNELSDLIGEIGILRADAAALGTDQGLVTNYFTASAQAIVNGANITGAAFYDLLGRFPQLIGAVREAGITIDETARAIEAASRRLGYQDRIFNSLNDNSSLAGQLAVFDRNAQRERAEEIRLGGDAINELEGALAAERLKIITDFADSAAEEQKRALQEAQNFFDTLSRNLKQFVDGLRSGPDSPLSPQDRLAAAQTQYNAQLALAQGGDRDAINGLTTYASALLEAGQAFYASSSGYQQIFEQVTSQLLALPTQVSAEQFIVDAIENAANATISAIDTNGDGFISLQEATNANLGSIFRELDLNGDGQISALELIRGATTDGNDILEQSQLILGSANGLQTAGNAIAASQATLLASIQSLQTTAANQLQLLNSQLTAQTNVTVQGQSVQGNLVDNIRKIVFNTALANQRVLISGNSGAVNYTFAQGGYVEGPGTATSDSISARLSNGEFVMRAAAVDRFGVGMLRQMNDNFSVPAVPVPFAASQGDDGSKAVVAELRRLHDRIAMLEQRLVEAEYGAASAVKASVEEVAKETRGARADQRQSANRPRTGREAA